MLIEKISSMLVGRLVKNEVIDQNDEIEINHYKYGVELIISSIITTILLLVTSILFNHIESCLIFLFTFVPIRKLTGGFHADTYLLCNLSAVISFIIILLFSYYINIPLSSRTISVVLLFQISILLCISPVDNKNKPIDDKDNYFHLKLRGVILYIAYGIISILFINTWVGKNVFYTLEIIFILSMSGFIKEGGHKYAGA